MSGAAPLKMVFWTGVFTECTDAFWGLSDFIELHSCLSGHLWGGRRGRGTGGRTKMSYKGGICCDNVSQCVEELSHVSAGGVCQSCLLTEPSQPAPWAHRGDTVAPLASANIMFFQPVFFQN